LETIVKNRRTGITEKGEAEMKTLIDKQQVERTEPETAREQQPQKVIIPKTEIAEPVPSEPKKETLSEEVTLNKGLCATCNEAPHCAYARNATVPVLFCEMFDDGESEQTVKTERPPFSPRPTGEEKPASQLKGLCVNCDHRHTCTFPKPEGGVWHCEEYR